MSDERDAELAPESRVGEVLDGRYRLDAMLGSGGLGVVYRAQHLGLERPVALKVLHGVFADHEEVRRRFAREARVLSTLEHDNIVRVSDFHTGDRVAYLCMELLEGQTLADVLDAGPPPIEFVTEVSRQILRGVAAAHAKGILHRDLKPANIFLVTRDDGALHVKILDFGLAKMAERESEGAADPTITRMGTILGTPDYMSPEQVTSQPADARADVYSMGIVMYELLTGQCPFTAETRSDLLRAHLVEPPPPLASMRPGLVVEPALEAWVAKALAKQRKDRFADAREMLDALEAVPRPIARIASGSEPPAPRSGEAGPTVRSTPPTAVLDAQQRRRLIALALALLGVLTAGAFALSRKTAPAATRRDAVADPERPADPAPAAPAGPPAPRDLLADVPPALRPTLRKVRAGLPLDREEIKALRDQQFARPDDVRPSLLLARDYASRAWWGGALERYRLAYQRDPSSRGGEWFLEDLVHMTESEPNGDAAVDAIAEIYGVEALPAVRRALEERTLGPRALARLEGLAARLEASR